MRVDFRRRFSLPSSVSSDLSISVDLLSEMFDGLEFFYERNSVKIGESLPCFDPSSLRRVVLPRSLTSSSLCPRFVQITRTRSFVETLPEDLETTVRKCVPQLYYSPLSSYSCAASSTLSSPLLAADSDLQFAANNGIHFVTPEVSFSLNNARHV